MCGNICSIIWIIIKIQMVLGILVLLVFMTPSFLKGGAKVGNLLGKKFNRKAKEKLEKEKQLQEQMKRQEDKGGFKW